MGDDLSERILDCLVEKPRSISEIARELDEEKYEVSKQIDVLADEGRINTYTIGRSTACIRTEDDTTEENTGTEAEADEAAAGDAQEQEAAGEPDTDTAAETEPDDAATEPGQSPAPAADVSDVAAPGAGTPPQPASQAAAPEQTPAEAATNPQPGDMPRRIGIVSGKGGVGKTVVTLNLGAALMEMGENVIVLDADAEMPNMGLHLGIHTYPTSLKEVVEQDVHIMSAMHVDNESGLRVIPTSLSAEPAQEAVSEAIGMIPSNYTVLVDSPPGYERPLERVIETCDELVFVTTPEIPALADTYKLYQEARNAGKHALGVVVNMYQSSKNHLSLAEVEESLELPVLGVVDHSKHVPRSIMENTPVVAHRPHAKPSRQFKEIAADLSGHSYDPSLMDRLKGLLP